MPYCPNCGKEAPQEYSFACLFCGKSLSTAPPPPAPEPTSTAPLPQSTVVPISYQVQTTMIPFDVKASRLELFVRIVWGLLFGLVFFVYALCYGIVILLYGIVAGILNFFNFFMILILARRWDYAFVWQAKLIQRSATYYARLNNYMMQRTPYLRLMTDRRSPFEMEREPDTVPGKPPS